MPIVKILKLSSCIVKFGLDLLKNVPFNKLNCRFNKKYNIMFINNW